MYRCALLGCGGRARGHADAYRHIQGGTLAAICDMDTARLRDFGDRFDIATRYTDFETMLREEAPDVLHIVTPPQLRLSLLTVASEHGVPAVIIEKPIALEGEDYRQLREFAATTKTKVCVNHQLHFHPRSLELQRDALSGHIGDVRLIDASARLGLAGQGTHILELVSAFSGGAKPTAVFGQVAGGQGLDSNHPAPDQAVAMISFDSGTQAMLVCGTNARPINDNPAAHMHKRIAAYGTRGLVQWTMSWWERTRSDGSLEKGFHEYHAQDVLGQAGLTEGVFAWLDDEAKVHPTNLDASLAQFNVILGLYMSALRHRAIELPVEPDDGLLDALRQRLRS